MLHEVIDVTGPITVNGAAVSVTLSTPGQTALLTFSGMAGQQVRVPVNNSTLSSCASGVLSVLKPDGTTLGSLGSICTGNSLGPLTMATSGTHTVKLEPGGISTGNATVSVTSP